MISRRGINRGCTVTGKSTHFRRIEGVQAIYYQLFYSIEGKGLLDPLDELRVVALYHVYWAKTQEKLDIWSKPWSHRGMGTTKSSPIRLWVSGWLPNLMGNEFRSYLPYFISYKRSDFYTSLVQIVLTSKAKRGTRLIAESFTQTEKYINFKRRISTRVFAYKPSKTQNHKG